MRSRPGILRRILLDQELHFGGDRLVRGVRQHRLRGEPAAGFQRNVGWDIYRHRERRVRVAHVRNGDQFIDDDGRGPFVLGEPYDVDVLQRGLDLPTLAFGPSGRNELAAGQIAFDPFPTCPVGVDGADEVPALVVGHLEAHFLPRFSRAGRLTHRPRSLTWPPTQWATAKSPRDRGPWARAEKPIADNPHLASTPSAGAAAVLSISCPPGLTGSRRPMPRPAAAARPSWLWQRRFLGRNGLRRRSRPQRRSEPEHGQTGGSTSLRTLLTENPF